MPTKAEQCTVHLRCWDSGVKGKRLQPLRGKCAVCGETLAVHAAEHPHDRGDECPRFQALEEMTDGCNKQVQGAGRAHRDGLSSAERMGGR